MAILDMAKIIMHYSEQIICKKRAPTDDNVSRPQHRVLEKSGLCCLSSAEAAFSREYPKVIVVTHIFLRQTG
jgi:hypothetical protein